jgi:hypothetical protein
MIGTQYTLDDIKFGIDERTWKRAVDLYESNKVKDFKDIGFGFSAKVQGTHLYDVLISKKNYDQGDCSCYLGQNDTLCKHMIAVAIYGLKRGKRLSKEEKTRGERIRFSGKKGELSEEELEGIKGEISAAMRYIKAYTGPSKIWFAYQNNLVKGCNRLAAVFSKLPASRQTADLIIRILLRLDRKLSIGGVDDSDGTVGDLIEESVNLLLLFAKVNPESIKSFKRLKSVETCFGWEKPLLKF